MLPDTALGHYRILSPLGKGGMGEVYLAEDTRLHRNVALKILPLAMASDSDRRKRFEREAQAVAALNHPNIVTIHSVEEVGGVMFLTMEAVEGRTVKDMLASGPIALDTVFRVAGAVSDALAAAHQRGITHRDLKPANVMVTPDGRVKVLDFGLAKLREAEQERADQPTKLQTDNLTGEGRIIGTVAYMSPEQAEGKPVDQRSDIFSLGVMLHEMAAGERPFKGDTDMSVISSILKDTPSSITDIRPELPPGLARLVRRCLAKDPARRYQTATDVRNELDDLKQDLDSGITATSRAAAASSQVPPIAALPSIFRRRALWVGAGAIVAIAVLAGSFAWKQLGRGAATSAAAFTAERFTRLTDSGSADLAALSPDGRYVVHVKREDGLPSVWVRQTATTSDVRIVPPADVNYDGLAFSPDGIYVYYVAYPQGRGVASLYRIPALGGAPVRVLEDIDSAPAFSPDGRSIAFVRGDVQRAARHLMVAGVDGSGERVVATTSGAMQLKNETPAWSPDGRTILGAALAGPTNNAIVAVDAQNGTVTPVGESWVFTRSVRWMPDGRSFVVDGVDSISTATPQVWQVEYPSGSRRRITNDLNGYVGVSLSADGRLLATVQSTRQAKVWVIPADGGDAKELPLGTGRDTGAEGLAWTRDGRLVYAAETGGFSQLWIARADGTDVRQLTSGEAFASSPAVSPDGRWIYYTRAARNIQIWRGAVDGSDQRALTKEGEAFGPVISPDGQWVYFNQTSPPRNRVMRMKADGSDVAPVRDELFTVTDVSPDGTELLGSTWNAEKQRSECAVLPIGGGTPRLLGDSATTENPFVRTCRWALGGKAISYLARRDGTLNLFARPVGGGPERQLTRLPRDAAAHIFNGALAPDGRIALSRGTATSDVVLIAARQDGVDAR